MNVYGKPVIQIRADGWIQCDLPDDESGRFSLHALRRLLPIGSWRPVRTGIRVLPVHKKSLLAVLAHYYQEVEQIEDEVPLTVGMEEDVVAQPLLEGMNLDPETLQRAYRALAKVLHPDVGGSTEAFVRLKAWADRKAGR